jgi:hypothetical protein
MAAPKRRGAPLWHPDEDSVLRGYMGSGLSRELVATDAAQHLDRSEQAIVLRTRVLGLEFPSKRTKGPPADISSTKRPGKDDVVLTPRKCLMCGYKFASEGAGHRICKRCKASPEWKNGSDPQMVAARPMTVNELAGLPLTPQSLTGHGVNRGRKG